MNTISLMALAQNVQRATIVQQLACPAAGLVSTYAQSDTTGRLNVVLYVTDGTQAGRTSEGKNNPFRG